MAATSASFVQAALPVHTSFAAGIENVQEKGHTFIKGRVIDSDGNPLVGVTVQIEGTSYGVITDADGNYILEFPSMAHPKIVFSSIGYKSKSIEFRGVKEQNMMLELDHVALDDLVVIGYGSKSRKDVTTAISTVSQEQISKLAATTPTLDGLLQGTVKGVLATTANGEPGSSLKLNIRGITSPYPKSGKGNNNQPLYVIDGVPTFMEDTGINPLINISPNDIESIDVLKDAAATAIYGSRGANGVVIVKTKNGKRNEKTKVDFGYTFSFSNPIKNYKPLNISEYKNVQDEILRNTVDGMNDGSSIVGMYGFDYILNQYGNVSLNEETGLYTYNGLNESLYGKDNVNWADEVINKNAPTHQYNVAVRGGSNKTNYSFSFNGMNQEGLLLNDRMERYGARLSIDSEINKYITVGGVLDYTYSSRKSGSNDPALGYDNDGWMTRPDLAVRDADGNFQRVDKFGLYTDTYNDANAVAKLQRKTKYENDQFSGNAYIDIKPVKGLTLHADANISRFIFSNSYFSPKITLPEQLGMEPTSTLAESNYRNTNTSINFRADYKFTLTEAHRFDVMAGYSADRYWSKEHDQAYSGFPNDDVLNNASSATTVNKPTETYSKSGLNSIYGRLSYDFLSRYLLDFSLRSDESSKFGPGNKRGTFPAVSLAWRINQEPFLESVRDIDDLKFRLSWGKTGSTNVSDFSYIQYFNGNLYGGQSGLTLASTYPNRDIKWEMTTEYNAGVDFTLFNGRLTGSFDIYHRKTDGALAPAPIALEFGIGTYYSNILDLTNNGFEFSIGGDVVRTKDFTYNTMLSISSNRNKITKLNGSTLDMMHQDLYMEGHAMGTVKGYKVAGIYQSQDQIRKLNEQAMAKGFDFYQDGAAVGDYMFADTNGDGYISEADRTAIANPEPKVFGGWSNTLSYKNFTLSMLFQYQLGGDAYYSTMQESASGAIGMSILREMYGNTWTPDRTDAKYAKLMWMPSAYTNTQANDRYVYSNSYFRLRNITLSYTFEPAWLERLHVSGASVFFTATNLFTITDWPGLDPDMAATNAFTKTTETKDVYPMSRSFSFGLKLQF
ncbi:SusC/RagA family TonB-linked outer membrane protein [Segatella copri]|uniref:TonB-dependent receptor n=1 Tax=Segatella copri TaxID=165179 RepID=A0AAW4N8C0_9BACT|nr:TonB-dependent receptor [Segatella copri]MBV3374434.1 TonB-dependent receptor [Segatella copri]MBV3388632.1 TonB-dependent receptor [Segatella copri]MBV3396422.1 TonB-dependent receptor [Segatella copri]MBV3406071.1 TonB-dependent receptor [Segatella copri]